MVLGIMSDGSYDSGRTTLQTGDLMFLYSDGVTEAANAADDFFGDDRLEAAAGTLTGSDAAGAVSSIVAKVREFAEGHSQSDDITLVSLRRT
jgi:sigma-B regulation protein RsbU (phosphoserine phosphatase)